MIIKTDDRQFMKDMNNIIEYSIGFMEGINRGKETMMNTFAGEIKYALKEFIDSSARVSPDSLHHIYEWYQTGSPASRLFDIDCTVSGGGISFYGKFSQSQSIQNGSKTPFYNKAEVMENGIPVKISPITSQALVFDDNGQTVFTKKEVVVTNPGGDGVQGSFGRIFDQFFNQYFSQAFILSSGVLQDLKSISDFAQNLNRGKRFGRSAGLDAGQTWISRAGNK